MTNELNNFNDRFYRLNSKTSFETLIDTFNTIKDKLVYGTNGLWLNRLIILNEEQKSLKGFSFGLYQHQQFEYLTIEQVSLEQGENLKLLPSDFIIELGTKISEEFGDKKYQGTRTDNYQFFDKPVVKELIDKYFDNDLIEGDLLSGIEEILMTYGHTHNSEGGEDPFFLPYALSLDKANDLCKRFNELYPFIDKLARPGTDHVTLMYLTRSESLNLSNYLSVDWTVHEGGHHQRQAALLKLKLNDEGVEVPIAIRMVKGLLELRKNKLSNSLLFNLMNEWDLIAEEYSNEVGETGDLYHQTINKALLKMLGSVKGKRVLDLACGNGYLSRLLSKKGAEVIGVDFSKELIKIARDKGDDVKYYVNKAENMKDLTSKSQDMVVSNMAFFDIKNLKGTIKECARVLKKNGELVFSIKHPFKELGHRNKEFKLVLKKYNELITIKPEASGRVFDKYHWYHRPLNYYTKLLFKNQFVINGLEEVSVKVSKGKLTKDKRKLEFKKQFPSFMIIKARLLK